MKIFISKRFGFAAGLTMAAAHLLGIQAATASEKTAKTKESAPVAGDATQYVGPETCKTCHEDIYKAFEISPHWKTTLKRRASEAQGCEACHGPGKAHVEGGGDKSKIFSFAGAPPDQAIAP